MHKWSVMKAKNSKPATYAFLSVVVVASLLPLIWFFASGDPNYLFLSLSMLALLGGAAFYLGFIAPKLLFYETDNTLLLIRGPFGTRRLPWEHIVNLECLSKPQLTRIIGVALPDLQYGLFHVDGVGVVDVYSGGIDSEVVMLTLEAGKPILLTPERQDVFIRFVREHLSTRQNSQSS